MLIKQGEEEETQSWDVDAPCFLNQEREPMELKSCMIFSVEGSVVCLKTHMFCHIKAVGTD